MSKQQALVHYSACLQVLKRSLGGDCCRKTPTGEYSCDGTSVDPLEVMFVKVKSYMAISEVSFTKKALKYQQWQQQVRHTGQP